MENAKIITEYIWAGVKAISTLVFIGVISVKIYQTPMNLTVDFPTLLSLLLAVFSVGLAALFYFKATDTSNQFYDNTYKFTRDISTLLVRIESGFGEQLRSIDKNQQSMSDYVQRSPDAIENEEVIQEKEKAAKTVSDERDDLVTDLLAKTKLLDKEKTAFFAELKAKNSELTIAQHEIFRLEEDRNEIVEHKYPPFIDFTLQNVLSHVPSRVSGMSKNTRLREIKRAFMKTRNVLPRSYLEDLTRQSFIDDGRNLTESGAIFFDQLVQNFMSRK